MPVPVPPPPSGGGGGSSTPSGPTVSGVSLSTRGASSTTAVTSAFSSATVTFDSNGNPAAFTTTGGTAGNSGTGGGTVTATGTVLAPVYTTGDINSTTNPYFAIGSWSGYSPAPSGAGALVYTIGTPTATLTPVATTRAVYDMSTFPTRTATPVYSSMANIGTGYVDSARLIVDFLSTSATGQLAMSVVMPNGSTPAQPNMQVLLVQDIVAQPAPSTYALRGTVSGTGSGFSGLVSNTSTDCANGTATCSNAQVQGFFSGSNADTAALSFNTQSSAHGFFGGAVSLDKNTEVSGGPGSANPTSQSSSSDSLRSYFTVGSDAGGSTQHLANVVGFTGAQVTTGALSGSFNYALTPTSSPAPTFTAIGDASNGNTNDPVPGLAVAWGYWSSGSDSYTTPSATPLQDVHYVAGQPTTVGQLPYYGSGSYTLVGGTTPTLTVGSNTTFGTLKTASLNVNFFALQANASATVHFGASTGPDTVISSQVALSNSGTSGATFSGTSGANSISGFLASSTSGNPDYAAFTYSRDDTTLGGRIGGAVGLQANSIPTVQQTGLASAFMPGNATSGGNSSGNGFAGVQTDGHYMNGNLLNMVTPSDSTTYYGVGSTTTPFPATSSGASGTLGASDYIGWGYWAAGARRDDYTVGAEVKDIHYVVGTPTPTMPTSGTAIFNVLLGNTAPTFTATPSSPAASATLNSASLTANFASGSVSSLVNVTLSGAAGPDQPVAISSSALINGSTFTASSGSNPLRGIFVGDNASRVGFTFAGGASGTFTGNIAGAVALGRSAAPPP